MKFIARRLGFLGFFSCLALVALPSLTGCAQGFADMAVNDNAAPHAARLGRFPLADQPGTTQLTASNPQVQCAK